MISDKAIYTRKELDRIRKSLGAAGLSEVAKQLDMNIEAVRVILINPNRYNETVFEKVAEFLEVRKKKRLAQKQRIKQAI